MNILITGGNAAKTYKLFNLLSAHNLTISDYGNVPSLLSSEVKICSLGKQNEETAIHNLLNICLDNQIELLIPTLKFEIKAIAEAKQLFNEFNIIPLVPEMRLLDKFLNENLPQTLNIDVYMNGVSLVSGQESIVNNLCGVFYIDEAKQPVKSFFING